MTQDTAARTVWGPAPSADDFAAMAQAALDAMDEPFRFQARSVAIRIEDLADAETLEALFIQDPFELTGLYSGVALTLELVSAPSTEPPMVWLYRLAILDEWMQSGDVTLEELVAHVVVHELGHHFGWSDEEMDAAQGDD
jgi:predicted Zn-dependent protease with MMP-like domain